MSSSTTLPILTLVGVSLGYGLLNVGSRWLAPVFGTFTQVYFRIFLAMILVIAIYFRSIRWSKLLQISLRDWLIILLMGTAGYGFMVYSIVRGALLTSLLNVSVIFSTVPIFVYFLSVIFLRRPFRLLVLGILILSTWGVGILSSGHLIPTLSSFGAGDWWVLLSTFFEAIWYLGMRLLGDRFKSPEVTFLAQAIAILTILPLALFNHEGFPPLPDLLLPTVILGLIIGVGMNIIAPLATMFAFRHLDEVFATQLFLTENIFSLFIGSFFYHEARTPIQLLGACIVIGSVYLMNKTQASQSS